LNDLRSSRLSERTGKLVERRLNIIRVGRRVVQRDKFDGATIDERSIPLNVRPLFRATTSLRHRPPSDLIPESRPAEEQDHRRFEDRQFVSKEKLWAVAEHRIRRLRTFRSGSALDRLDECAALPQMRERLVRNLMGIGRNRTIIEAGQRGPQ
jgi:hypothetical protein